MTTISIIIPTFRRPASLARTLEALAPQTCDRLRRVYVVNDAGPDPVPADPPPRLRHHLVRLTSPCGGPAVAANVALAQVEEDLIAFLDDDSVPATGWLRCCLELFDAHPEITAQLGRILWTGPIRTTGRSNNRLDFFLPRLRQKIYDSRHLQFTDPNFMTTTATWLDLSLPTGLPGLATHLSCGNAAVRMGFLRQHGLFDPAFRTFQDRELAWRILAQGGLIAYNPAMIVYHEHNPSFFTSLARCWSAVRYQQMLQVRYPGLARRLLIGQGAGGGRTRLMVPLRLGERIYLGGCRIVELMARVAQIGSPACLKTR